MRNRSLLFVLFACASLTIAAGQAAKPVPPPKVDPGTSLANARAAIQKTVGTDSFPLWLKTYATAMTPTEAMTLCREFIPKARSTDKALVAEFAASLALVAGRLEDAAYFLAYPGSARPDMLLDAVRCNLAMGKTKIARGFMSQLPPEIPPAFADGVVLAYAWLALMEGTPERAREVVSPLIHSKAMSSGRREALFVAWLSLASSPEDKAAASSIRAALESDFPLSVECSLVKGNIRPQPSAWLLEGLYPYAARTVPSDGNVAAKPQAEALKDGKVSTTTKLQVGWFSRKENAQGLMTALKGKGFSASLDEQTASDGAARWAVIVEASGDWTKTQAQLKDLGYESYLVP